MIPSFDSSGNLDNSPTSPNRSGHEDYDRNRTEEKNYHEEDDYNERHRTMRRTIDQSAIIQSGYVYRRVKGSKRENASKKDSASKGTTDKPMDSSGNALNISLKTWKKRWAVLRSHALAFYKDEREYELKELLVLEHVHQVTLLNHCKGRHNIIVLALPCGTKYLLNILPITPHHLPILSVMKKSSEHQPPSSMTMQSRCQCCAGPEGSSAPEGASMDDESSLSEDKKLALNWLKNLELLLPKMKSKSEPRQQCADCQVQNNFTDCQTRSNFTDCQNPDQERGSFPSSSKRGSSLQSLPSSSSIKIA